MGFDKDTNSLYSKYKFIKEQQVFNPWPDEPVPSGNDTTNYRGANFGGKLKPVDYVSLFPKEYVGTHNGSPMLGAGNYMNLPQSEKSKILNKLVVDYATQAGINLNSDWGNKLRGWAASGDTSSVLQNLQYANNQASQTSPQQQSQTNTQQPLQSQDNSSSAETERQRQIALAHAKEAERRMRAGLPPIASQTQNNITVPNQLATNAQPQQQQTPWYKKPYNQQQMSATKFY